MKDFFAINLGQVVSLVVFVVGAFMVWQKMRDKLEALEKDTDRNTRELDQLTKIGLMTTVQQHERRLTDIEHIVEDYRGMQTDIRWIKERITEK